MEENQLNNDQELEQFLREETSNQAMFPADHIWENIRTELHGNRSWPALTFIALFIISSLTISTFFNYPPKAIIEKELAALTHTPIEKPEIISADGHSNESIEQELNPNHYTEKTIAAINANDDNLISTAAITKNDIIVSGNTNTVQDDINKADALAALLKSASVNKSLINSIQITPQIDNINSDAITAANTTDIAETVNKKTKTVKAYPAGSIFKDDNPTADAFLKEFSAEKSKISVPGKFALQFYATPSVSYRRLSDDKQRSGFINLFAAASQSQSPTVNINDAVKHTPAIGLEAGVNILYNLTKNLKIKTGLQFNIRQYYIDAYQASYGIATIAFVQNNHLDSVNIISALSNSNGYYSTKLDNKLYQVSIPVGLQWDFIQGKKFGLSAGASFQPTFTLNKNMYAISTDYKYYANGAPFLRKWNWNSSFDLSFTFQTKDTKWYIGPQVRYQHLPTYNNVYPIKEYRMDYGLKIGFIKPLTK
jgi:hypothetical protein